MRDTAAVLDGLIASDSNLLAIVANERGATDACSFERIKYLGYPFSVSEEFQQRNTNSTIEESFKRVEVIKELADKNNKEVVLYLSMGFGNPYDEAWHPDIVANWAEKLYDKLDINIQAVSDTIGAADSGMVDSLFSTLIPSLPKIEFGAHLHTIREEAQGLVKSAFNAGCRRFDSAIMGLGGCPMAKNDLTGNMPTELMLDWFDENRIETGIDMDQFRASMNTAQITFP